MSDGCIAGQKNGRPSIIIEIACICAACLPWSVQLALCDTTRNVLNRRRIPGWAFSTALNRFPSWSSAGKGYQNIVRCSRWSPCRRIGHPPADFKLHVGQGFVSDNDCGPSEKEVTVLARPVVASVKRNPGPSFKRNRPYASRTFGSAQPSGNKCTNASTQASSL